MTQRQKLRVPPAFDWAAGMSWRFLVLVAALYVAIRAIVELRLVVVPLVAALFLATLLGPPVRKLRERNVPSALAAAVVFILSLGLFVGLFALLAQPIAGQLSEVTEAAEEGVAEVISWLTDGPLDLTRAQIDGYIERAGEALSENRGQLTTGAIGAAITVFEILAGLLLALVIAFFFVKDSDKITAYLLDRTPPSKRELVRGAGERAWYTIGGYIRGTAAIAFVDAVGIGIGLMVIGVPLVLPLAVITFFASFIPIVGAVTAGALATLVALVTTGFTEALLVLAVVIGVQQVEGNVLQPVVMGRAVRLHPVVILFSLTAGAILGGILGALFAVPTAAVISTIANYIRTEHDLRVEST